MDNYFKKILFNIILILLIFILIVKLFNLDNKYENLNIIKENFNDNYNSNFKFKELFQQEQNKKNTLEYIHNNTKNVDMKDELPEQEIIFEYLPRNSKVLELGGNIGRSSIIISNILNEPKQHVVVESDPIIAKKLKYNRDINNLKFNIEIGAISNKKMIQNNWITKELNSKDIPENWKEIPTITLKKLYNKYNIDFDTIIADCEGCLFNILKDNIWILKQIKTIIVENDFNKVPFIDFLKTHGFKSQYCRDGENIPVSFDKKCFYQVWIK